MTGGSPNESVVCGVPGSQDVFGGLRSGSCTQFLQLERANEAVDVATHHMKAIELHGEAPMTKPDAVKDLNIPSLKEKVLRMGGCTDVEPPYKTRASLMRLLVPASMQKDWFSDSPSG